MPLDNKEYDAAIHLFQHVINKINPRNVSILHALGFAYLEKGDLKKRGLIFGASLPLVSRR